MAGLHWQLTLMTWTDTHSKTCGILYDLSFPGLSTLKPFKPAFMSQSTSLFPTSNLGKTPQVIWASLHQHSCFPLPSFCSIKLAFGILKLNLFKNKQLGAYISQMRVTDRMRRPKTSGAEDLAGLRLSGDTELIVMFPKGISQGSKVELFTNTVISP